MSRRKTGKRAAPPAALPRLRFRVVCGTASSRLAEIEPAAAENEVAQIDGHRVVSTKAVLPPPDFSHKVWGRPDAADSLLQERGGGEQLPPEAREANPRGSAQQRPQQEAVLGNVFGLLFVPAGDVPGHPGALTGQPVDQYAAADRGAGLAPFQVPPQKAPADEPPGLAGQGPGEHLGDGVRSPVRPGCLPEFTDGPAEINVLQAIGVGHHCRQLDRGQFRRDG